MSSGGKGGGAQKSLNYYATIAGAIGWGPLDWLTAIIANGNYVWQCGYSGPLDLTAPGAINSDGYVDLTGGVLDPTLFMEGGYLRLYAGQAYGNPDPALPGHPSYQDTIVLVAKHIFFGQNSGTAPNVQVIGGRRPRVPTTIVAAADNVVDDRQVNPVAAIAEILLDERGGGMVEASLDAASWLFCGHWCAQDAAHKGYSFIAPLIADQRDIREIVKQFLEPLGMFLRWTPEGKLGCYLYEWGVDPGGVPTFDARHYSNKKKPQITDGDWKDIPTELNVTFIDRAYEFQENSVTVPNQRAADIRQVDDPRKLDRPHVTRAAQAFRQGDEYMRRMGFAPGKGTVPIPRALLSNVRPGDKIKIDDDPEPGGAASAQMVRVDRIVMDRGEEATLDFTVDPLVPAVGYTPSWLSPLPESLFAGAVESAPSIAHFQTIPLPLDYFGWPPSVGFLATRPSTDVIGFHAYFANASGQPFSELGAQFGFAARCQLVNAVGSGTGTLRLQLLDGASGPDAYIAADTPGGNAAEAQNNQLLAILMSLDGSGRVARDGNGQAIIEFASVLQRSAVTSDTHDYTVYRGRCGLSALAWGAGAVCWIIPIDSLVPWTHDLFESMFDATGYFRVASFTSAAVDESSPLPECDLVFPSIPAPNGLSAANGTGKAVSLNWLANTFPSESGEYAVYRATGPGYGDWAKIGETRSTRFVDHEVVLGTTYAYKIAAVTPNELASQYSNTVTITVAKVIAGDIDQTQPNDPGAPTLVSSGTYVADDGRVVSYLMIRVQQLPAAGGGKVAATYQELRYRVTGTGATGWRIQDQPENTVGTKDIRVDDLVPGAQYDIEVQAYSRFDIPSANTVAAVGSPLTAPKKTALPTAPSSGSLAADSTAPAVKSDLTGPTFGCRITVTAPTDKDIKAVEVKVTFTDSDAAIDYTWGDFTSGAGIMRRACTPGQTVSLTVYNPLLSPGLVRARAVDSSGNVSNWFRIGNANSAATQALGDMAVQNKGNVQTSGIKIGSTSASSVQQVLARQPFDLVPVLTGGTTEEAVSVSLSNRGFTTKPDGVTGAINVSSDTALKVRYDWDDAANSSTNAVLKVSRYDGAALSAGPVRLQGEFFENF